MEHPALNTVCFDVLLSVAQPMTVRELHAMCASSRRLRSHRALLVEALLAESSNYADKLGLSIYRDLIASSDPAAFVRQLANQADAPTLALQSQFVRETLRPALAARLTKGTIRLHRIQSPERDWYPAPHQPPLEANPSHVMIDVDATARALLLQDPKHGDTIARAQGLCSNLMSALCQSRSHSVWRQQCANTSPNGWVYSNPHRILAEWLMGTETLCIREVMTPPRAECTFVSEADHAQVVEEMLARAVCAHKFAKERDPTSEVSIRYCSLDPTSGILTSTMVKKAQHVWTLRALPTADNTDTLYALCMQDMFGGSTVMPLDIPTIVATGAYPVEIIVSE